MGTLRVVGQVFRKEFRCPDKDILHWFPGHMGKGLNQINAKMKTVDCVIEVHDGRVPFSGRNPEFRQLAGSTKPYILVLNKKDLTDLTKYSNVVRHLKEEEGMNDVILTNCKDQSCSGIQKIVPLAEKLIVNSNRYNRSGKNEFCIMIMGVPNVGKSSLINSLRHKYLKRSRGAPVGGVAGITRSVTTRIKVCESPLIYLLDTPGILTPSVNDIHSGFKLALCSSMNDNLVGVYHIADYLLFWLNKNHKFEYVDYLELPGPSDDISEVLVIAALKLKRTKKIKGADGAYHIKPDLEFAASYFIKGFRNGHFGKVMLDNDTMQILTK